MLIVHGEDDRRLSSTARTTACPGGPTCRPAPPVVHSEDDWTLSSTARTTGRCRPQLGRLGQYIPSRAAAPLSPPSLHSFFPALPLPSPEFILLSLSPHISYTIFPLFFSVFPLNLHYKTTTEIILARSTYGVALELIWWWIWGGGLEKSLEQWQWWWSFLLDFPEPRRGAVVTTGCWTDGLTLQG